MDLSLSVEERRNFCDEWTNKELKGLSEEKITKEDFKNLIDKVVVPEGRLKLRKDAEKIFDFALANNIPMYVLSAGLGDVIEPFLTKTVKSYSELKEKNLITIVSNFLIFDEKNESTDYIKPCLNTFTKTDVS